MCRNIVFTCPCDNVRANVENAEYADVIDSIEQIISSEYDGVITGGDWNTCLRKSNAQTQMFNNFVS